jgi:hypothetical protein
MTVFMGFFAVLLDSQSAQSYPEVIQSALKKQRMGGVKKDTWLFNSTVWEDNL